MANDLTVDTLSFFKLFWSSLTVEGYCISYGYRILESFLAEHGFQGKEVSGSSAVGSNPGGRSNFSGDL